MVELNWDKAFAMEQVGDDEELLDELVELFQESSLSDLAKINNSLAEKDSQGVGDAAHSIKGAAASLGIEGIRLVAASIEKSSREGSLQSAQEMIPELEILLEEFKKSN